MVGMCEGGMGGCGIGDLKWVQNTAQKVPQDLVPIEELDIFQIIG